MWATALKERWPEVRGHSLRKKFDLPVREFEHPHQIAGYEEELDRLLRSGFWKVVLLMRPRVPDPTHTAAQDARQTLFVRGLSRWIASERG